MPERRVNDPLRCSDPLRFNSRFGGPSGDAAPDICREEDVLLDCDLLEKESFRCGGGGGGGGGVAGFSFSARTVGKVTPLTVVSSADC